MVVRIIGEAGAQDDHRGLLARDGWPFDAD
jgi:hypothetical protein